MYAAFGREQQFDLMFMVLKMTVAMGTQSISSFIHSFTIWKTVQFWNIIPIDHFRQIKKYFGEFVVNGVNQDCVGDGDDSDAEDENVEVEEDVNGDKDCSNDDGDN